MRKRPVGTWASKRVPIYLLAVAAMSLPLCDALAESQPETPSSPARQISPSLQAQPGGPVDPKDLWRRIDGRDNNLRDPQMGAAFTPLRRRLAPDYADGVSTLAGPERPGPRDISNIVNKQESAEVSNKGTSDFLWQWGQFLDHDIDLTDGVNPPEPANIRVPLGDPHFDPIGTGDVEIRFNRSIYDTSNLPLSETNPRQQLNQITAWIDASNVYGSDQDRSDELRLFDGSGRLKTSPGGLLPFNTNGFSNAGGPGPELFLAGDVRANEQVGLIAMHTLFVREHNRLAALYAAEHPNWNGEEIFQKARQTVGALMQVITYEEFLPALLGKGALSPYKGYDPKRNTRIANLFSTAAYRFGHSALSPTLKRLGPDLQEIAQGHLPLRDAFFAPSELQFEGALDSLLRGLAHQVCQSIDLLVVDDVRNFLFDAPGPNGFDLAALNIQRGRDHGLPSYNDTRAELGLTPAAGFADVTSDLEIQRRLSAAYESVEDLDLWIGGLAEDPYQGALVGKLFYKIIKEQFGALRDGDRFWYERILEKSEVKKLRATRLSDVIRRNSEIGDEIPDNVFAVRKQYARP